MRQPQDEESDDTADGDDGEISEDEDTGYDDGGFDTDVDEIYGRG